jgi:hypothetical protein
LLNKDNPKNTHLPNIIKVPSALQERTDRISPSPNQEKEAEYQKTPAWIANMQPACYCSAAAPPAQIPFSLALSLFIIIQQAKQIVLELERSAFTLFYITECAKFVKNYLYKP